MRQQIARTALRQAVRGPFRRTGIPRSSRSLRAATGEKKGMDTDISLTPIISTTNTNASSFVLNLIQQGSGSWNRVGRKAILRSLRIKGAFSFAMTPTAATGAGVENTTRMVVVWDKQPSGAAIPTFDTIFGITAQDGTESCPDIWCPPKYDNMDRFKILKDETIDVKPESFIGSGSGPQVTQYQTYDTYLKLGLLETVFQGQSAPMTIADISTGAIYIFFRAAQNSAVSSSAFDGIARLRYSD